MRYVLCQTLEPTSNIGAGSTLSEIVVPDVHLDGVYVRAADGKLRFHELPEPTAEDVAEVARRTAARPVKVLKQHGREALL